MVPPENIFAATKYSFTFLNRIIRAISMCSKQNIQLGTIFYITTNLGYF